ncbi:MAG: DUF927 domain-containing protein, partial [Lachnospiraceae bacterium]|nr:DUF927 domain-containing protein [Lachnospiraceae bacterium]
MNDVVNEVKVSEKSQVLEEVKALDGIQAPEMVKVSDALEEVKAAETSEVSEEAKAVETSKVSKETKVLEDSKSPLLSERQVCVTGIVYRQEAGDAKVLLRVYNRILHEYDDETMLLTELDSTGLRQLLIKKGYIKKNAKVLAKLVQKDVDAVLAASDRSLISYSHSMLGWFKLHDKIGFKADKIYTESGLTDSKYDDKYMIEPHGDINVFLQMMKDHVQGNEALEPVCCMGLSTTVLPYANMMWGTSIDNINNHLMGTSSTGKSTAAALFVSFGSVPFGADSMTLTFLSTDNALLNQVAGINGYPVAIEELSTSGRKKLTELVYALSNGSGKIRCTGGGTGLSEDVRFSTIFLTNGETSLIKKCLKLEGITA